MIKAQQRESYLFASANESTGKLFALANEQTGKLKLQKALLRGISMHRRLAAIFGLTFALFSAAFAQTLPPDIVRGRDWLRAQVQADGTIIAASATLATERQTRAETLETLARFNVAPATLLSKVQNDASDAAVEHLARKIIALGRSNVSGAAISNAQSAALTELKGYQNADGGFGGTKPMRSSVLDTSFALLAFRAGGVLGGEEVARAVTFLGTTLSPSAGATLTSSGRAQPYIDAYTLLALQTYAQQFPIAANVDAAKARLLAGATQGVYLETLLNCTGVIAISLTGQSDPNITSLRGAIRGAQAANGSWGNDAFLTALALRALTDLSPVTPPTLGLLSAVIRDAQSLAPLAGASLTLNPAPQFTATANSAGAVQISDITPGGYSALVAKAGYQSRTLTGIQILAGQALDLGEIQLLRLANTALLRGQVTDVRDQSPIAGASIVIGGSQTATVSTGPDGKYEYVAGAGAITIAVSKTGFQSAAGSGNLVLGQTLVFSPALYAIGLPQPTNASLIGKIVSTAGDAPIAGATVVLGAKTATSGSDGRFALADVSQGAFQAAISKTGYVSATLSGSLAQGVNDAGLVRLSPVNTGVSSLSGRVTDAANGTAISTAQITIDVQNLAASSDSDGRYRISAIQTVPFSAEISAPGYATRVLTAGQSGHANFSGDAQLSRLVASNVILESVVMGAPQYQPYTEASTIGTVRNNGATSAGLIFNAIVRDSQNRVIRDTPAIATVFNSRPGDNIITIPANASKAVTIKWGVFADLAGDYTVSFRGVSPEGQVLLEGPTIYRVNNAKRIGGGIDLDPPLLQAGLNQPVNITGQLSNVGNVDIAAGTAELTIKLVRGDSRPVVSEPPVAGNVIASGTPMYRPERLTRDADGNFYTLNNNPATVVRISPLGVQTELGVIPYYSGLPLNANLGTVAGIGIKAGALVFGRTTGWVSTMSLMPPYTFTHAIVPFDNTQGSNGSIATYYVDRLGNEYFASHSPNVVRKRDAAGVMTTLSEGVDADYSDLDSCPNGKLYAASRAGGAIIEIDPGTGRSSAFVPNALNTTSLICGADGVLYYSEIAPGGNSLVRKRSLNGTISLLADGFSDSILDLRVTANGTVFVLLNRSGEIWNIAPNGTKSLWTRGLINGVNSLHYNSAGDLQLSNYSEIRRLKANGTAEDVGSGLSGVIETQTLSDQRVLWLGYNSINEVIAGVTSVLTQSPAHTLASMSQLNNGAVLVAGAQNAGLTIDRMNSSSLQSQLRHPGPDGKTSVMPNGDVIILRTNDLFKLEINGNMSVLPQPRFANAAIDIYDQWISNSGEIYLRGSANKIYRYDLVSGALTLTHAAGEAVNYGFVIDAQGRLIFSRGNTVVRFDPANSSTILLSALPANTYAYELVITNADLIYTRGSDGVVYRIDLGATTLIGPTTVNPYAYDLQLNASREQPTWREYDRITTLTPTGPGVPVLVPYVDSLITMPDGRLLWWRTRESEFTLASATAIVERKIPIVLSVTKSVAIGDVLYTLGGAYVHRYTGGSAMARVGYYPGADTMAVCGGKVWINQADGLYEIDSVGALVKKLSSTVIADNAWGNFACYNSNLAVQDRSTKSVLIFNGTALAASYAGFASASNLIERPGGKWWVAGDAALFEVDADGRQARVVTPGKLVTLAKSNGSYYGVGQSSPYVYQITEQGRLVGYASQYPIVYSGVNLLAPSGTGIIAGSSNGQLYKKEEAFFKVFASGLGRISRMSVSDAGQLWVGGDFAGGAVGKITPIGFEPIASGIGNICAIEAIGETGIAVGIQSGMSVFDLAGRKSMLAVPGEYICGLLQTGSNTLVGLTYYSAKLTTYALAAPPVPIAPGTIVHRETKAHAALPRNASTSIAYTAWTPAFGGDFELDIKSTDTSVAGALHSGLHVGALATAQLSVTPNRVTPSKARLLARTALAGADFTTLARINIAQIEQIFSGVYPKAMGLDATGAVWFTNGASLSRAAAGVSNAQIIELAPTNSGQIPIDALGRAYVATTFYDASLPGYAFKVHRVDVSGVSIAIAQGPGTVTALAMDANNTLYALMGQKILRITQLGQITDYATLPSNERPFGLTIDGVGTLYAQMRDDKIFQIDTNSTVTRILLNAGFEYEGVNIAGTCAEGLLFTPSSLDSIGQFNSEEYTIGQLLGQTGEIGPVLNGRLIGDDLSDLDFIVYDKFASNILVMSDITRKMFKIPVTCGAIDVDYHLVLFPGQDANGITPAPSQTLTRADGSKELVWQMRDVNAQGVDLRFDTELDNLIRGTDRPIAREAFMEFRNTFGGAPVRQAVPVPTVHVDDLVEISARTDRVSYPQSTPVLIDVAMRNIDEARKTGRLLVRILDSTNAVVATLIDRAEVFGPNESRVVNPPFNTALNRAGAYVLVAQILADAPGATPEVLAEARASFAITVGSAGQIQISSTVAVDKANYGANEAVIITADVLNDSLNQSLVGAMVKETVLKPDATVLFTQTLPLANLEPRASARLSFPLTLAQAAAGIYSVRQEVLSTTGAVLSAPSTSFTVSASAGNDALSGTLSAAPVVITRGQVSQLTAMVLNRGTARLTDVPISIRVLDPAALNQADGGVLANFPFMQSIDANAQITLNAGWATNGVALSRGVPEPDSATLAEVIFKNGFEQPVASGLGDYLAVLVARIGGTDRVLAQTPLKVVDIELSGTLTATPASVFRGEAVALAASARNSGNIASLTLPFSLRVTRLDTGALVREFSYSSALAVNGTLNQNESLDSTALTPGNYRASWSVQRGAASQNLAQATFTVLQTQLAGTLAVSPSAGVAGTPFRLDGLVRNVGNAPALAQLMRIEVRRADTQVLVQTWSETSDIGAAASYAFVRVFDSSAASAGSYRATIAAFSDGAWQDFASAGFDVSLPLTDVVRAFSIQRDARVLALVSCTASQIAAVQGTRTTSADRAGDVIAAASVCESNKTAFLNTWFAGRGLSAKVVLTSAEFSNEMRCGKYNVYWLAGGSAKLSIDQARELREVIYRGEGLLQDSSEASSNTLVDGIGGYSLVGPQAAPDLAFTGAGTLFPAVSLASYGSALNVGSAGAQVEARFNLANTPAIVSNSFGQGRAISYSFDLVELLKRDGAQAAQGRLFDNALSVVAPTVLTPDYAGGSYVAVTASVQNRGQPIDLRIAASVNAPATLAAVRPAASAVTNASSFVWDLTLPLGATRNFDGAVQLPFAATPLTPSDTRAEFSRRDGALLTPLGVQQVSLTQRDLALSTSQLIAALNAATLPPAEAAARTRAITAITAAQTQINQNAPLTAITQYLSAATDIAGISSISNAVFRLSNARLMELAQRRSCGLRDDPCDVFGDLSSYSAVTFEGFSGVSSAVQGRIAAGFNVNLTDYQVAGALPVGTLGASLVVSGSLIFPSGSVQRGNILVRGSIAGVGASVIAALGPDQQLLQTPILPVNFSAQLQRLAGESARLAALPVNTTMQAGTTLALHGNTLSELQVFSVTDAQLAAATSVTIDGVAADASVLINVSGNAVSLNATMSSLTPLRGRVLLNIPTATTLSLAGSIEAAVLAPRAVTQTAAGLLYGNIITGSWNGPMQINAVPYLGCTRTLPPTADKPKSAFGSGE
jgi:choice-of-anchor A domain-containing protein